MIDYVTKEDAIAINKFVTSAYGQSHAMLQESNLEHYLEGAKRYAQDIDNHQKKVLRKAAYILYHLAYDAHVFLDGNKRTALSVTLTFMHKNLDEIDETKLSYEEKAKVVKEIAKGDHKISFIEK